MFRHKFYNLDRNMHGFFLTTIYSASIFKSAGYTNMQEFSVTQKIRSIMYFYLREG